MKAKLLKMIMTVLAMGISITAFGADFHVAPQGKDSNPGTKSKPFATLSAARDAIRELPRSAKAQGVTVWIDEGRYPADKSFTLEAKDSGTEKNPIVYRARENAKVVFDGGVVLKTSDWKSVTDSDILKRLPEVAQGKVKQIDLKAYGFKTWGSGKFDPLKMGGHAAGFLRQLNLIPDALPNYELFCNDQPLQLGRWPNTGYVKTGKIINPGARPRMWMDDIKGSRGGSRYIPPEKQDFQDVPVFAYRDARHARWTTAEDPWIFIWNNFFSDLSMPVRKIDNSAGAITLEYPLTYGLASGYDKTDKKYYIFNLLEEIDQPGEWYLNRETGLLYCWPPVPLADAQFVLSRESQPAFVFKDVSHLMLQGITIANSRAEQSIRITGGQNVVINAVTIKNLAGSAIKVEGGKEHKVVNCDIFNTGTGGIYLEGGDRKTLTPAGHLAENNHIHDVSRIQKSYSEAIELHGVGNVARHNKLHGSEHAVLVWKGNDHLIEYNEIFDAVRTGSDMGAIYTGRDITCLGVVIRYNYFHHIGNPSGRHGTQAIFLDDGTSGHHIYGNVFFKAGSNASVKYHGGTRNILENNICIGRPPAALLTIAGWGNRFPARLRNSKTHQDRLGEIDPTSPPWSERWPWLATVTTQQTPPGSNKTVNNVVVNSGCGATENFVTNEDPGFVDMKNHNFALKKDSLAFKKLPNFKPIPFEKIGLKMNQ